MREVLVCYLTFSHLIAWIDIGSSDALRSLLSANAHQAFIYAISVFQPTDSSALRSAFTRALRAIVVAIADAVGPEQWGVRTRPSDIRDECSLALDYLFEVIFVSSLVCPYMHQRTNIFSFDRWKSWTYTFLYWKTSRRRRVVPWPSFLGQLCGPHRIETRCQIGPLLRRETKRRRESGDGRSRGLGNTSVVGL